MLAHGMRMRTFCTPSDCIIVSCSVISVSDIPVLLRSESAKPSVVDDSLMAAVRTTLDPSTRRVGSDLVAATVHTNAKTRAVMLALNTISELTRLRRLSMQYLAMFVIRRDGLLSVTIIHFANAAWSIAATFFRLFAAH